MTLCPHSQIGLIRRFKLYHIGGTANWTKLYVHNKIFQIAGTLFKIHYERCKKHSYKTVIHNTTDSNTTVKSVILLLSPWQQFLKSSECSLVAFFGDLQRAFLDLWLCTDLKPFTYSVILLYKYSPCFQLLLLLPLSILRFKCTNKAMSGRSDKKNHTNVSKGLMYIAVCLSHITFGITYNNVECIENDNS